MFIEDKKTINLKRFQLVILLVVFFLLGFICGKIYNKPVVNPMNNQIETQTIVVQEEAPKIIEPQAVIIKEEPRYNFTEADIHLLALVLSGDKNIDGDGEYDIDFETPINHVEVDKVLSVIMNRVSSDIYPNTVSKVVKQPGQFAVIPRNLNKTPSDISLQTVREWCDAYNYQASHVELIPSDHLYFTGNGITNTTRANWK